MRPDPDILVRKLRIPREGGGIPALLLSPKGTVSEATGVLWLHGGGYFAGMKEMVHASRAVDLVKRFGAVVLAPGYRLSLFAPYPAALEDGYASLLYLKEHAADWGVRSDQLMVGGESAGGGLCAAVCLRARDEGTVRVAFQMPLYPMLDDRDTESSRDNHGKVWNTRRNHLAWTGSPPTPPRPGRRTLRTCRRLTASWGTASPSTPRQSGILRGCVPPGSRRSWMSTTRTRTLST